MIVSISATLTLLCGAALAFLAERLRPGRALPESAGWYVRATILNATAPLILGVMGYLFEDFFREHAVFSLASWPVALQVAAIFPVWSFVFYWWHRAIHLDGLWHVFHQMHHSPSRIEVLTTFYKHPAETIVENSISGVLIYVAFGASAEAGIWIGTVVGLTGFFSHANIKTPKWIGYFLQRPEHHSIHHQWDLHRYNYADFILWDRIFGTFKEAETFSPRCGFPGENEKRVGEMLRFKDVYH